MKTVIGGLALGMTIVGVGGCASLSNYSANYPYIEDLERDWAAKNYKPNFTHSNMQVADTANFDGASLIGQWECQVDVQSHTLCGDDMMSTMSDTTIIEKRRFSFNSDGTYSQDSPGLMNQPISHTGQWKYEDGVLKLSQRTSTRMGQCVSDVAELRHRVVWYSDGRVLITEADGERTTAQGAAKSRVLTSTDQYGVQSQKIASVATVDNGRERGFLTVFFRSPAVYSRVGGKDADRACANGKMTSDSTDYRIVEFERRKDKNFSYAFTLALPSGEKASNLREICKKFGTEVKQSYVDTFHSAKPAELQVLLDWRLESGLLKGVASVVHVSPVALTYDANTRIGRVTVRAEKNQLAEARNWIGKNIKKIVCEKNIALETGTRPTEDAHYSVTREAVKDDGLIEVEFKAE